MGSRLKTPKRGGINHLHRLLGMRSDDTVSRDAAFVSIDLEGGENKTKTYNLGSESNIRQIGIATLDTRDLQQSSLSDDIRTLISVSFFEVIGSKQRDRQCDLTPTRIHPKDVAATITRGICIHDDESDDDDVGSNNNTLRNIILVGHSLGSDLSILRQLGLDIASLAPVLFVLDTHSLSRYIFPPYSPLLPVAIPEGQQQDFSLAGVLARFSFRPAPSNFHNAANDAQYTLMAMVFLAIQSGEGRRRQFSPAELGRLARLEKLVSGWRGSAEYPFRLSAGLREVASRILSCEARE
ncbi:hypothetical protein PG985_015964 [Apiospora marii]|uniref:uncharacterized protein n=1 Tax=Apiospora marii TaxID=335849 RepID=UPI00313020BA